jgi:acetoin utilization deacetylase AcuC-like enzyme
MKTVYSDLHKQHVTKELLSCQLIDAHECPERANLIVEEIRRLNWTIVKPLDFGFEPIRRVHDDDFLQFLETIWTRLFDEHDESQIVLPECFPSSRLTPGHATQKPTNGHALSGYYSFDMSAGIGKGSWEAIYAAAQVAITAADLLKSEDCVFALCRPPGHHATPGLCGGYCYINNAAVAIAYLIDLFAERVACLDIDFHHGNGTSTAFEHLENPLYVSLHGKEQYPYYTGHEDEVGVGEGKGYNLNIPLEMGTNADEYLEAMTTKAFPVILQYQPKFLVVSLGVDTFKGDVLGGFNIDTQDYLRMGRAIGSFAKQLACKTLFVMEGGYVLEFIGKNVTNVLLGFEESNHGKR